VQTQGIGAERICILGVELSCLGCLLCFLARVWRHAIKARVALFQVIDVVNLVFNDILHFAQVSRGADIRFGRSRLAELPGQAELAVSELIGALLVHVLSGRTVFALEAGRRVAEPRLVGVLPHGAEVALGLAGGLLELSDGADGDFAVSEAVAPDGAGCACQLRPSGVHVVATLAASFVAVERVIAARVLASVIA
jgi:hypothetical protein